MTHLDWKVGDKVVCINAGVLGWRCQQYDIMPEEGRVYTIRRIGPWVWGGDNVPFFEGLGLWLNEIMRPIGLLDRGLETPYGAERFRPVQKRKTDISIFTALLNTQDELEEVPFQ